MRKFISSKTYKNIGLRKGFYYNRTDSSRSDTRCTCRNTYSYIARNNNKSDCGFCEYHSIGTEKQIGYFLTMADANRKNYMLMGEDCREVFTISVVDGTWHIDAAQNPSAFSPDTVTWGNAATVTQATNTVNSQYGEELLGMYLRDVFPTISNGVIRANCIKGVCVSCGTRPIRRISPI